MIIFDCPGCRRPLKTREEQAGKKSKCPHCGQPVQVPQAAAPVGVTAPHGPAPTPARNPNPGPPLQSPAGDTTENSNEGTIRPTNYPPQGRPPSTAHGQQGEPGPQVYDFLSPPRQPDEIGWLGPYRILKELGTGAMGVVFKAEDPHGQRLVALKVMQPGLAANEEARQRFLREARVAAAIDHAHVVTVYQVGEEQNIPYLTMPLLLGETLEDRLWREGKLPIADTLRIGREAAEGLAAAHARGLIHRDIKPANIWLEEGTGRIKILDFGLARATGDEAKLTLAGAILGTPAYMAPEQAANRNIDHRCDLFSLGCVLYRVCTGQMPFGSGDTMATLMAVATKTPTPPAQVSPRVPEELSALVMRLLEKPHGKRPASAKEVVETIQAIEQKRGLSSNLPLEVPPAPVERLQPAALGEVKAPTKAPTPAQELPPRRHAKAPPPVLLNQGAPTWVWLACGAGAAVMIAGVIILLLNTFAK